MLFTPPVFWRIANGNDSFTKLLLHNDGTNGSSSFTDSSGRHRSVTANNSAQVSTSNVKFGSGSLLLASASKSCLTVANNADLDPGTADFTYDGWIRHNGFHAFADGYFSTADADVATGYYIALNPSGNHVEWVDLNNSLSFQTTGAVSNTTYTHVAVVRHGDTITIYLNGTASGSLSGYSGVSVNSAGNALTIGDFALNEGNAFNGNMDEIRWTVGKARWTSNFTPPTLAYS